MDKDGIKCMSLNFLMEDENQPVVWRGPIVANAVKQFYTDVIWGDLDVLFIDMPPGTGDVALDGAAVHSGQRGRHGLHAAADGLHDRIEGGQHVPAAEDPGAGRRSRT